MNSNSLTTLARVRDVLNAQSGVTTSDAVLELLIDAASARIIGYCGRNFRVNTYTEYHNGDGKDRLFLKQFPVISVTSLYDSYDRTYAAADLIATTDYIVMEERGEIILEYLYFNTGLKNIRVIYSAGYESFEIIAGYNDKINFKVAVGGAEKTATLTAGTYTAATLATHIGTVMTAAAGGDTITVTYNIVTGKFTIASSGTVLQLLWLSGTNTLTSCGLTIGFIITADDTGALTYTADNAVLGIPEDLQNACAQLVMDLYHESSRGGGGGRQGIVSKSSGVPGGGSTNYAQTDLPVRVKAVIDRYKVLQI